MLTGGNREILISLFPSSVNSFVFDATRLDTEEEYTDRDRRDSRSKEESLETRGVKSFAKILRTKGERKASARIQNFPQSLAEDFSEFRQSPNDPSKYVSNVRSLQRTLSWQRHSARSRPFSPMDIPWQT